MRTSKYIKYTAICCCISMIITLIVVIAVSFATLEPTQVGLDFDSASQSMNENELFRAGRYFIGPTSSFIKFPTELKPVSFDGTSNAALESRTKDGLKITVSTNFQYRVKDNLQSILNLIYTFGEDYELAYKRIARNIFRDTIASFTAFQLVNERANVEQSMRNNISVALDTYEAIVVNFQLLDIVFPTSFSTAISDTQDMLLTINKAENNKIKTQNDVAAQVSKATIEAQSLYNAALGNAATIRGTAQATGTATEIRAKTLTTSFSNLKTALSWQNKDLINYQFISSLESLNLKKQMKVNLGIPDAIRCLSDSTVTCPT